MQRIDDLALVRFPEGGDDLIQIGRRCTSVGDLRAALDQVMLKTRGRACAGAEMKRLLASRGMAMRGETVGAVPVSIVQKALLVADDYDRFPAFIFREEPAGAVAGRAMIGLIGLIAPALLIGWLGLRALRRYSVAQ